MPWNRLIGQQIIDQMKSLFDYGDQWRSRGRWVPVWGKTWKGKCFSRSNREERRDHPNKSIMLNVISRWLSRSSSAVRTSTRYIKLQVLHIIYSCSILSFIPLFMFMSAHIVNVFLPFFHTFRCSTHTWGEEEELIRMRSRRRRTVQAGVREEWRKMPAIGQSEFWTGRQTGLRSSPREIAFSTTD